MTHESNSSGGNIPTLHIIYSVPTLQIFIRLYFFFLFSVLISSGCEEHFYTFSSTCVRGCKHLMYTMYNRCSCLPLTRRKHSDRRICLTQRRNDIKQALFYESVSVFFFSWKHFFFLSFICQHVKARRWVKLETGSWIFFFKGLYSLHDYYIFTFLFFSLNAYSVEKLLTRHPAQRSL